MNATEHLVETYFRVVRRCFTIPDVKVLHGNNRQMDLLAYCPADCTSFHVETGVTHQVEWGLSVEQLVATVDYKFCGVPASRDSANPRTDAARGKSYWPFIEATYREYGLEPLKVRRVVCCWVSPSQDAQQAVLDKSQLKALGIDRFELLSFRDTVIPRLKQAIGRSNYDDEILRTLSLLVQYERQTGGLREA